MKKIMLLVLVIALSAIVYAAARTCNASSGLETNSSTSTEYSLSNYPVPFPMIARSQIYNVASSSDGGLNYKTETKRLRRDMNLVITSKVDSTPKSSIYKVISVRNVDED